MKRLRLRFGVRWLMIAVAALALLIWSEMQVRRILHYRVQAQNHAWLEAKHWKKERHSRTFYGDHGIDELADSEAEGADRHSRLKAQYQQLATRPWEGEPQDLLVPFPWNHARDRAVLEAVLTDLMDPLNLENNIEFRTPAGAPRPEILVGETSYPRLGESEEDKDDAWRDLDRRSRGGPHMLTGLGLRGNLEVRYDDPGRLFLKSADAETGFSEYFEMLYPQPCGYARVTLPGYSRDGRRAVVFVSCGFAYHPVKVMNELEFADSG